MGNNDFELANLLLTMQASIRGDIKDAKDDLTGQIAEVKDAQIEQGKRLSALEEKTGGIGLTKAQKAALWTGISGLAFEGLRHLKSLIFGLICLVKGVPKL